MNNGKLLVFSAPSGSGKTTIVRYLLEQKELHLDFSISATSREKRGEEIDGRDYYFLTMEEFQKKIDNNEFVEYEEVYKDNFYGTLKSELERIWADDKVPVLDIDVKGAIHVQQQFPQTALSLFIEPPSVEELKRRLSSRGTETEESLQARVNKAAYEISFKHHFNLVIVNDDLNKACVTAENAIQEFLHH